MKKEELDILFLGGAQHNNNSKETHDDYIYYFSTSITDKHKKEADNIREKQASLKAKAKANASMSPIITVLSTIVPR